MKEKHLVAKEEGVMYLGIITSPLSYFQVHLRDAEGMMILLGAVPFIWVQK